MDPFSGGMDLRHGCFLVKMYVKMKELVQCVHTRDQVTTRT